jgi:sialate O-acetylesterase
MHRFKLSLAAFAILVAGSALRADVKLPGFFNDHMVLQRDIPIPVWGWAEPNETVTVQIDNQTAKTTTADANGRWRVALQPLPAGGPHTLNVSGANKLSVRDVLIGEVWLCSGQSNMEWTVNSSLNAAAEIAAADFPMIRHIKVAKKTSGFPLDDLSAPWQICSPATAGGFTAAGYFMARHLHRKLGVPIGLINSSWGGTRIEPWTPPLGFASVPALKDIELQVARTQPENKLYRDGIDKHLAATERWLAEARTALAAGQPAPISPGFPDELKPLTSHQSPTTLYNAMIHPLVGYGMRGAIWYQGESNHSEGMLYNEKKKALIAGWRKLWGLGNFPFYYVQIAPFTYGGEDPRVLARFWEAQAASEKEIPNTGMVVISDVGNVNDIHPKNKQEVGRRLALLAMAKDYGRPDIEFSGPKFESLSKEAGRLRVRFSHAKGLKSRDGKALDSFELIGENASFVKADAEIDGETVLLSAPGVTEPAAMRFAWHKLAEPNLANAAGLPASAFRAGEIPKYDFLALKVAESADYELVYDLDLLKLKDSIRYEIDRSKEIPGGFDRIAYFVELTAPGEDLRYAYASMDAFTDDLSKIAVPTVAAGSKFQMPVNNLTIISNDKQLKNGSGLPGNIEFWSHNYNSTNGDKVPGASDSLYDFGDTPSDPVNGYGCMQVHSTSAKQTVFAINNWRAANKADLGIGNSTDRTRDWTFTGNAGSHATARLRVLVRLKK